MKRILLYFLIFYCHILFSQNQNEINIQSIESNSFKKDTTYIKSIKDKIIVKFSRDNKIESFTVSEGEFDMKILPNFKHKYNISIEYDFFAFSFSLPKSWTVKDDEIYSKGKSSGSDYNLVFFKNHWINRLFYNETIGFYVENTNHFIEGWNGSPYIQLPNAKVKKIGGATSYLFNAEKLSIRAINNQTEVQEKSAGSLLATLNYEYNYLSDRMDNIKSKQHKYIVIPSLEYQYNLVLFNKKLLLAPRLAIGYGYSFVTDYDDVSEDKIYSNTSIFLFNTNISANYTFKNLFCGIQYNLINNYFKEDNSRINNTITYGNIYVGYKFNTPKIINKLNSKIKRVL